MPLEVHSEARTKIERSQSTLLESPLIGDRYGRRLRKFPVGDYFPHSIGYAVLADVLFVLAYAHGSRRPGYWRARVVR